MGQGLNQFFVGSLKPLRLFFLGFLVAAIGIILAINIGQKLEYIPLTIAVVGVVISLVAVAWRWYIFVKPFSRRRRWLITFGLLVLVLSGVTLCTRNLLWRLDHSLAYSSPSPDGKYIARFYNLGEAETPPYGDGVAIAPGSGLLGPYSGEDFVFKGSCEKSSLSWTSAKELTLYCTKLTDVFFLERAVNDVRFSVIEDAEDIHPGGAAPQTVEWQGHVLQEVLSLSQIPQTVQSSLGGGRPGLEGIADRGRPFNKTDVVYNKLPMRRLIVGGHDGSIWLIAIEHGGYAYYVEAFLFVADDPMPKQKWHVPGQPKRLSDLVRILSTKGQHEN